MVLGVLVGRGFYPAAPQAKARGPFGRRHQDRAPPCLREGVPHPDREGPAIDSQNTSGASRSGDPPPAPEQRRG
jgi:hypothetical protein